MVPDKITLHALNLATFLLAPNSCYFEIVQSLMSLQKSVGCYPGLFAQDKNFDQSNGNV